MTDTTKVDMLGYTFYRKDRLDRPSGGVGVYITDRIPNRRANEYEVEDIELMWVEITLGVKKFLIGICYRAPHQSLDEVEIFMSRMQESFELVYARNRETIILMGDFNDTCTQWDSDHELSDLKLKFFDFINNHDLHQMVHEPTHILGPTANILDLLITDSPGYVNDLQILPPLGSLHQVVYAKFKIQYRRDCTYTREIWDYKKGDYIGLNDELKNVPWGVGLNMYDEIDDITDHWQSSFLEVCKRKIPNRIIKIRPTDKPWITHEVKINIRKRNRLYKSYKRSKNPIHEAIWKEAAKTTNFIMNQAKLAHTEKIKSLLSNISIGEKSYWKIAKEVYGSKKIIGIPAITDDNKTITTSSEKAQCFNKYFTEQQTLPPLPFNQQLPPIEFLTDSRLEYIQCTTDEITKILKSLDTGKANGPDGISNKILKETAESIASPLSNLINKSLDMCKVPNAWKGANVCPIHKKQDKSIVSNYRPISLLSCVGKVQERVVYRHLYDYLATNNLLTWKNSGFKELDSAVNQLIYITDKIYKALESGKEICMVFLDVSKAFDRVWHSGLLNKLRCMGIEGRLFDWICDYLTDRRIRVVINGQKSDWSYPNAGVPQGSILGPLLFLVFINDITEGIESDIHLFADDTSLVEIIDNYIESYAKLNRDLVKLANWSNKWLVTFNANKTVYLKISRKINKTPKPVLYLHGIIIKEVTNHKHLGLTFNQTLTWSDHIHNLVTKAAKCVGLLRRICREVPRSCLEVLYKSMIRPILEYGDVIFDGSADSHVKRLEDVQRQAALTCTGAYRHTRHTNLLDELGWPPLMLRRKHHRLSLMYKIQNGLSPSYLTGACPPLTRDRTPYDLRSGHNITAPQTKTTCYQKSFFPASVKNWNDLEINQREVKTVDTFKEHLKKSSGYVINKLFHHFSDKTAINHTRMRLGLSGLASHRCDYKHIVDPKCTRCNAKEEDPHHFFLICKQYVAHRDIFLDGICNILYANNIEVNFLKQNFRNFLVSTLLNGSLLLTEEENIEIFKITQNYIRNTQRFP